MKKKIKYSKFLGTTSDGHHLYFNSHLGTYNTFINHNPITKQIDHVLTTIGSNHNHRVENLASNDGKISMTNKGVKPFIKDILDRGYTLSAADISKSAYTLMKSVAKHPDIKLSVGADHKDFSHALDHSGEYVSIRSKNPKHYQAPVPKPEPKRKWWQGAKKLPDLRYTE